MVSASRADGCHKFVESPTEKENSRIDDSLASLRLPV